MRLKDAIDQFSEWRALKVHGQTVKAYRYNLLQFCMYLHAVWGRDPELEEVTVMHVAGYFQQLSAYGYDANGLMPRAVALRKLLEFFRMQGSAVLHEELIPIPRTHQKLPRVATREQYRQLLTAIPKGNKLKHVRDRTLIPMLWDTGARNGEIISLNVEDCDFDRRRALIRTEKAVRRPLRHIFWTPSTNQLLKAWIKRRARVTDPTGPLFISFRSGQKRLKAKAMRPSTVSFLFQQYSNIAELNPWVNPHSFRHHLAHEVIQNGGSTADVANLLGHSTLNSSLIYVTMSGEELQERYRRLHR